MALTLSDTELPEDITEDEFEALRSHLLQAISDGVGDPLMTLDDKQDEQLIRLAFNDDFNLDKLERSCRDAIRTRGDGEPTAKRFNLKSFRMKAKHLKEKIAVAKALTAKLAQRNMKIVKGGKGDEELRKLNEEAPGDLELQAQLSSLSAHLRCIGILTQTRQGRVWFDTFYNNFFTNWDGTKDDRVITPRSVDDAFMLRCYTWLQMCDDQLAKSCSLNTVEIALHEFGGRDQRHEPQEWLNKLEWDGTPRLSDWLMKVYGVNDDEAGYHAAVGRCWVMQMAARIRNPGCKADGMPVLIGPEGTRKSTSLTILGGKWYATINTSADKLQDFLMTLNGRLLGEIAELDAISRTADSRVKTILTTPTDTYRPPYGRVVNEYPRTCTLAGSTNDLHWHKGENAGTRRYWPIMCLKLIDTDWLAENRDQLFAEAKVLLDGGAKWYDQVPTDEQTQRVMEHHMTDPWDDRIAAWIESSELWTGPGCDVRKVFPDPNEDEASKRWGTVITTSRVLTECIQMPVERQNKSFVNRAATVMRNMGFELTKIRVSKTSKKRTIWVWCVPQVKEAQNGQKMLPLNEIAAK